MDLRVGMWKQEKLEAQIETVEQIKDSCVISGGLAWHFMSPPHKENKYMHDHKDVDLFIFPNKFQDAISILKQYGFNRYWTKYDGTTPGFYRYGKTHMQEEKRVKVLLDLFIEDVPYIEIKGFKIVEPKYLLDLYYKTHSSKGCVAVVEARKLVARGIDPIGKKELIEGEHEY